MPSSAQFFLTRCLLLLCQTAISRSTTPKRYSSWLLRNEERGVLASRDTGKGLFLDHVLLTSRQPRARVFRVYKVGISIVRSAEGIVSITKEDNALALYAFVPPAVGVECTARFGDHLSYIGADGQGHFSD